MGVFSGCLQGMCSLGVIRVSGTGSMAAPFVAKLISSPRFASGSFYGLVGLLLCWLSRYCVLLSDSLQFYALKLVSYSTWFCFDFKNTFSVDKAVASLLLCGVCFKTHTLRSKCQHGTASVPPPDNGDGVVRFVLYDLIKPLAPSCSQPDCVDGLLQGQHDGFTLSLLDSLLSKGLRRSWSTAAVVLTPTTSGRFYLNHSKMQ
ncbi:hypothetical protein Tco_0976691 [Tanacetum coccineum]|uniref:Uncharacterized protein n=1 Tax=Tanacetum coccineum TaxID=301880 RepID=A0ABQ5EI47_9ASTR